MAEPLLVQASETELAAAVARNLFALFRSMQALPGCELVESEQLSYHHAFPANAMFKSVWRARLGPQEADPAIDQALDWFQAREAVEIYWWTDPQTQPTDLVERLRRRGFEGSEIPESGMAVNLHALNEIEPPQGFISQRANDWQSLVDWGQVFATAFGEPASSGRAWAEATRCLGTAAAPWQFYLGYLDGQPVASSMLFYGAGVAGVYSVGTLPAARRKGCGAAITRQPLLEARRQGYQYGVLFASRMGFPVYERLGFQKVAGDIGIYLLTMA